MVPFSDYHEMLLDMSDNHAMSDMLSPSRLTMIRTLGGLTVKV